MGKQTKIEVRLPAGFKQEFLAELRRRARWKGKRGAPYRMLLLAMAPARGEKETVH